MSQTYHHKGFRAAILCLLFTVVTNGYTADTHWLSEPQTKLLNTALKTDYTVSLMSGEVDGVKRNIVLLGEIHIKGGLADAVGRRLLELFPLRGLESVPSESPAAKFLMTPAKITLNSSAAIFGTLLCRNYDSTIVTAEDICCLDSDDSEAEGNHHCQNPAINLYLEQGSSQLAHILGINAVAATIATPILVAAAKYSGLVSPSTLSHPVPYWTIKYLNLSQLSLLADTLLDWLNFPNAAEHLRTFAAPVFPLPYYITSYRNRIMVDNIIQGFRDYPEQDTMLVIAGMAHPPGMARLLEKNYGFEQETLNSEEPE
ncbi:hypothetical protein [Parendozoicomonas haliclonae]|uniref:TraB family protein n=1 Tax=Parendozoicomonas haliclonae TaxID=1960125 RepID=A0A1X7ALW3_9GAMM|nr:hypothetical protein [Parendozoicomonas haliclonae]SMA49064.1 hypothetical protein EHSB41UT_03030 [Parendozoicomonas haliclonae]